MEVQSIPYVADVAAWLIAFALTASSEMAVVGWLGRRLEPCLARRLALSVYANLATHPVVWFVVPTLIPHWATATLVSEIWAWVAEAAFYRLTLRAAGWRAAVGLSLAANLSSFGLGLALWALGVLR